MAKTPTRNNGVWGTRNSLNLGRSIELEVDEHELAIPLDLEDGRTVGFQLIQTGAKTVQAIDGSAIQTVDYVSGDQGRVTATRIRSAGNDNYPGRNSDVGKHLCDLAIHIDSKNAQLLDVIGRVCQIGQAIVLVWRFHD